MNTTRRLLASASSNLLLALAAVIALSAVSPAPAEAGVFVKVDNGSTYSSSQIKGNATTKGYKDWIEAQSMDFGVFAPGNNARPELTDLTIIKSFDVASPHLAAMSFAQDHLPEVTIVQTRSTGRGQVKVFTVKLTNVRISSFSVTATADDPGFETLTLKYKKIELITHEKKDGKIIDTSKQSFGLK